jgi:formylglycine-generating enzyme required for sulfatase activity
MTTEIEQVRQLFQGFRRADAQLHDAETRSREAAVQAEQQARGSLERIGQQRVQTAAIPRQVAEMLAAMRPFLKSHAIEVPSTTQSAPPPAGASALTLIGQCAAAARRAHTELERLQRTLPTLVRVPAGQVRRRVAAWFTVDVEVQELPEFWIGETPVTNRQYAAFLEAQGGMIPAPGNWSAGRYAAGADERPVTDVSHEHAVAYCRWAGLQLPSAAQWLRAARGDSLAPQPPAHGPYGARDMLGLTTQWLTASSGQQPQCAGADGATDSIHTPHSWPRAGIRVARAEPAAPAAAPRRRFAEVRWVSVLLLVSVLATIGGVSWLAARQAVRQSQAGVLAGEQLDWVAVPTGDGLAAFRIGRTEVTNAQYAQCVEAGACTVPSTDSERCHYADASYAEHPVVCVTRAQARAYAAWVGGALPTEAQWLRACQGDDGRTYPWGEVAPDATLVNFDSNVGGTTPVGSYPTGASPYGLLDMAGNVWEWAEPNDGSLQRIVRGGAFSLNTGNVVCGARNGSAYDNSYSVGFRVVSPGP